MKKNNYLLASVIISFLFLIALINLGVGYYIDQSQGSLAIYNHARLSFIIILAGTMLSFIILIFNREPETKKINQEILESSKIDEIEIEAISKELDNDASTNTESVVPEIKEIPAVKTETVPIQEKESLPEEKTETNEKEEFAEPVVFGNDETSSDQQPLCFEEVLDKQLVEAASTEEDLTVLIVKINQLENSSSAAIPIKEEIKSKFFQQGLVYEFLEDSFIVIIKNTTLDAAMISAEELREKLISILNESGVITEVTMGLSSRNSRMLNAERLITEADQAQQHSDADSPIIAFRVDPEKYRQFILNSN